jgi:hypothetical protein
VSTVSAAAPARLGRAAALGLALLAILPFVNGLPADFTYDDKLIISGNDRIASPLLVQATLHLAAAVLAESALSFLGLGVPPPAPSWGAMLAGGRTHVLDAPHVVLAPAAAILIVVLGTNVLGDALVDRLDPARRPA